MNKVIESIVKGKAFDQLYTGFKFESETIHLIDRLLNIVIAIFIVVAIYQFYSSEKLLSYFQSEIQSNFKTDHLGVWAVYFGYILIIVPLCTAFAGYILPVVFVVAMVIHKKWYPTNFDKLIPSFNWMAFKTVIILYCMQMDHFRDLSAGLQLISVLLLVIFSMMPIKFRILNPVEKE